MSAYPFIVVEGLDGTGKTTLRKGLFRLFEGLTGVSPLAVLTTNFLDSSVVADLIEGKYQPTANNKDRYLTALATDKRASAGRLIEPSLAARPVIADRWLLSELAFFEVKHAMPAKETYSRLVQGLNAVPDLTVVLDLGPQAAVERAADRRGDAARPDWDVLDIQARVRDVYRTVVDSPDAFPALGPVARIDASTDRATVLHEAWKALQERDILTGSAPERRS